MEDTNIVGQSRCVLYLYLYPGQFSPQRPPGGDWKTIPGHAEGFLYCPKRPNRISGSSELFTPKVKLVTVDTNHAVPSGM